MLNLKQHFTLVDELRNIFIPQGARPIIALAGPFNTGKSTLINGLLGQTITPVDVIPATPATIQLNYGKRFYARVHYARDQFREVNTNLELNTLLISKRQRPSKILKVEIKLPHYLLQRLSLLDTPGIDAAGVSDLSAHQFKSVHHIVYLLHQRGPGEADRQFIQKLIQIKNPSCLSFWINRNLGHWDGSSLQESRRVLREICRSEVTVLTMDTKNPGDVEKFALFIQDQAALAILTQVKDLLKEQDQKIPIIMAHSLQKTSEAAFLAEFWPAWGCARQVIQGHALIQSIPPVTQKIRHLLEKNSSETITTPAVPVVYKTSKETLDPVVVRDNIKSVLQTIMATPKLHRYPRAMEQLEKLIHALDREQYLVTAVGGFSSGKSTFFNALLGESLLPAENRPTTFAITKLQAGSVKKAIINYAKQVKIPTHRPDKNNVVICRHELATLERWLSDTGLRSQITALKKSKNNQLSGLTASELLVELEQLKTTWARVKRDYPPGQRPWPALFKKIPGDKFKKDSTADFYMVHFARAEQVELNLETPAGRAALAEIAGSHLALRVETITVWHPAAPLSLATWVDTPGLDSVYQQHKQITSCYLPRSDCFVFMLNGKHILTKPDLSLMQNILQNLSHQDLAQKIFVVVNFSDTLTTQEQERVRNYLHQKLVQPSGGGVQSHRIYFISALEALSGLKNSEFSRLTRHLKNQIWSARCQDKYLQYVNQGQAILKSIISPGPRPENNVVTPRPARLVAVAELMDLIKQRMKHWHGTIAAFSSSKDFVGLKDGKLILRRGFLGLSRQIQPVPSCRDLARDINTPLVAFQQQWLEETDSIQGIDTSQLEETLELLLTQSPSLAVAKQKILALLAQEESRIQKLLQQFKQRWEKSLLQRDPKPPSEKIDPDLRATLNNYLATLGQLEQNILSPGGIKDGKRQNVG